MSNLDLTEAVDAAARVLYELPPLAEIRETADGWAVSCLACPMTVEPRPTVEQAVQDSRDHWQVWHSTKEERA